jgi:hypothetical protein
VPVLVAGQQQRPGERVDDLDGGGDVPALLVAIGAARAPAGAVTGVQDA